jgi:hypothetical protein
MKKKLVRSDFRHSQELKCSQEQFWLLPSRETDCSVTVLTSGDLLQY